MSDVSHQAERERDFHNRRFGQDEHDREEVAGYYGINRHLEADVNGRILAHCIGAQLLELGCGTGEVALFWAAQGAQVTAIDISDEGIRRATDLAGHSEHAPRFLRMDASDMRGLPPDKFDIVTGISVLHHLDLTRAYAEIARVLRPGGRAYFIEPQGHNVLINLFRRLTPRLRSVDEHPLIERDIVLARQWFDEVSVTHYHLFTLLAVPFRTQRWFPSLLDRLNKLDRWTFARLPGLRKLSWILILDLAGPHHPRRP